MNLILDPRREVSSLVLDTIFHHPAYLGSRDLEDILDDLCNVDCEQDNTYTFRPGRFKVISNDDGSYTLLSRN